MSDPAGFVPDPLDGLLQPPAPGEAGDGLLLRLLQQTTRVLRRRRRLRIVALAAALAACFVAGALTVYCFGPRQMERVVVVEKSPAPEAPPPRVPVPPPAPPASAVALEWQAFDADKPRPDLYREAGDRYLHEDGDPASAVRCYSQSLDGASDRDLAVSPDDDYLLMVVKQARLKEKERAKKHG